MLSKVPRDNKKQSSSKREGEREGELGRGCKMGGSSGRKENVEIQQGLLINMEISCFKYSI